jgi:hypothetical protein
VCFSSTIASLPASSASSTKERAIGFTPQDGSLKPSVEPFKGFRTPWDATLCAVHAENVNDSVPATVAVISNPKASEIANAADGVGEESDAGVHF